MLSALSRTFHWLWQRTNQLPLSLLLLTFLMGFLQAFPVNAFGSWLVTDVRLVPAEISTFYATIFIPWSLKPLYSFISEALPIWGRRRKYYVVLCGLLSGASYLLIAFVPAVATKAGVFGVSLMQTTANAFASFMLNMIAVDFAGNNMDNAGAIQSAVEAVDAAAAILAFAVGVPMYPCNPAQKGTSLTSQQIIGINSVFPFLMSLVALWLPDKRVTSPTTWFGGLWRGWRGGRRSVPVEMQAGAEADLTASLLRPGAETQPLIQDFEGLEEQEEDGAQQDNEAEEKPRRRAACSVYELLLPAVLLLVCWGAVHDLMSQTDWLILLGCVVAIDAAFAAAMLYQAHRTKALKHWRTAVPQLRTLWPAVVLFFINAMPSSMDQIDYYYYNVLPLCDIQWIQLVSSLSRLLGSALFFWLFNHFKGRRLVLLLLVSGLLGAGCTMFNYPMVGNMLVQRPAVVLGWSLWVTALTTLVTQVTLIASLTIATKACPTNDHAGFIYAVYVSFLDIGDSVAGWITAPITTSLGITSLNLKPLKYLVVVDAASNAAALLTTTPLLYFSQKISNLGSRAEGRGRGRRGETEAS